MRFFTVVLLTLVIYRPLAIASLVQPGDGPYSRLRRDRTLYIYEPTTRGFIEDLAGYNQAFRRMYDQSFGWRLDEEQDLILTSPRQQVSNAFAMVTPNIKSIWFPGGAGLLEQFAESSWLLTLTAHETSHLYQLDAKGPVGRFFYPLTGNTPYIFPFVWPIFILPNQFLPTSIVEGNAVLNESRVNMGGRLHSGEARALVLAQVAAGDVDASRLINNEFIFPFGENAYLQGGYFQAHLAAKYGIEKTNGFFLAQAHHFLWPLILNQTFRDHFGSSYFDEVHEYLHEIGSLAARQVESPGEPLIETVFAGPMNSDRDRVWLMTDRGNEPPLLQVFEKHSRRIEGHRVDMPVGKVFFEGDLPLSASSEQVDLHRLEYALFGEGDRVDSRFLGQIVTDRRAGHTVSFDAAESWLDPHILLDGEPYDIGHSNPVLDESGHVYYFRQNGPERLLYRDREPLFWYTGYYGKVTEVGDDGSVDFIANTPLGSSVFRYSKGEVLRLLPSDRVVDARRLNDREYLVTEVESKGHRVVVASVASPLKAERPATYAYAFATENVVPDRPLSRDQTETDERPYNAFRETRYSGLDLNAYFTGSGGLATSTTANFSDPLDYHEFQLGYNGDTQARYQRALVQYTFTKYLPQIYTRYLYRRDRFQRADYGFQRAQDNQVSLGIQLPLLRWRRWDALLDVAADYQHNDSRREPGVVYSPPKGRFEDSYGSLSRFVVEWAVPTSLGFYGNWREFQLSLQNRLDTEPTTWRKKHNTSQAAVKYLHGFAKDIYATGYGTYAWAENKDIDVDFNPYPLLDTIEVSRLTDHGQYAVRNVGGARVEIAKAINASWYTPRIPIGFNRLAPFVVAQGLFMDQDRDRLYPQSLFEYGWGVDFDLLLFHLASSRLRFLRAWDTHDPNYRENQVQFSMKRDF